MTAYALSSLLGGAGGGDPIAATFTSSGTHTVPTGKIQVGRWLLVGGGGGGGQSDTGGTPCGGAGASTVLSDVHMVAGTYTVTVGAGGAGGAGGSGSFAAGAAGGDTTVVNGTGTLSPDPLGAQGGAGGDSNLGNPEVRPGGHGYNQVRFAITSTEEAMLPTLGGAPGGLIMPGQGIMDDDNGDPYATVVPPCGLDIGSSFDRLDGGGSYKAGGDNSSTTAPVANGGGGGYGSATAADAADGADGIAVFIGFEYDV